jgi:hypothetical protein
MPPREGYSDVIFTRHWNAGGGSTIICDHADPHIRVSDVVMGQIASGGLAPEASIALPDGTPVTEAPATPPALFGAILTFACSNRHLVYRITGWEPVWIEGDSECGSYLAGWPG